MSSAHVEHAFAVILAGGSGTRLWPTSRDNTPKQFMKLGGTRTMMQGTVDRILPLIPWERIIVVTNSLYTEDVRAQLPEIPVENIIAEPARRDTAMAMALGSLIARHRDPEAVVVNIASDHVLKDPVEYRQVVETAIEIAAEKQYLLTVGIKPTSPNVNFGYIQAGKVWGERNGRTLYSADRFKEKPDLQTAEQFVAAGNYYWNANMYTWHVEPIMAAFAEHMPAMMPILDTIDRAIDTPDFSVVLEQEYPKVEKISIDYAISEKVNNLVLLEGDFGWDDIGLWSTVYELGEKDVNGTVVVQEGTDTSRVLAIDSRNNLVSTNGRLVATIGVEDLVVIDSNDVILILPRSRAADVKKVVEQLKAEGQEQYL